MKFICCCQYTVISAGFVWVYHIELAHTSNPIKRYLPSSMIKLLGTYINCLISPNTKICIIYSCNCVNFCRRYMQKNRWKPNISYLCAGFVIRVSMTTGRIAQTQRQAEISRDCIRERKISLKVLGIILRALRLEVSVYNVYITNKFQPTFSRGVGGGGG